MEAHEPFWMDLPQQPAAATGSQLPAWPFLIAIIRLTAYATMILFPLVLLVWIFPPMLRVLLALAIAAQLLLLVIARRRARIVATKAEATQRAARQSTGASHIGSAIHVAGHPLLSRDQPVVLALVRDQLSIHSYAAREPLAAIPLEAISSVKTVVYDQDRVPRDDIVDGAAQALKLTMELDGRDWDCLFRRMLSPRPIDWYHALQKAKYAEGSTESGAA
jgi:hypothetical protein